MAENARRDSLAPEYELLDTGVFDGDRFFDVVVEYAKAAPDAIVSLPVGRGFTWCYKENAYVG